MTFFQHQEQARKSTRVMLWLLAFSIVSVNLAVYFAVRSIQNFQHSRVTYDSYGMVNETLGSFSFWDPQVFGLTWIGTTAVIAIGAILKLLQLRGGGPAVAQMMGGRIIDPGTDDPKQRVLLNIIEEMSIASGCRIPAAYWLPGEIAINAFAAGNSQSDSVIAVTQGALEKLDRDQLQGVVAHEFSHILNSDVRLNMNLIGAIGGLVAVSVLGRILLRTRSSGRSSRNSNGPILLFGMALLVIGSLGALFARMIQAAVSRQREFLADASAVQFTRNPQGLAGALQIIQNEAHLNFLHPEESSVRHMMFAASRRQFSDFFATHPQIEERIRRLVPALQSPLKTKSMSTQAAPVREVKSSALSPVSSLVGHHSPAGRERFVPASLLDTMGSVSLESLVVASKLLGEVPQSIQRLNHTVEGAKSLVLLCLLAESGGDERPKDFAKKVLSDKSLANGLNLDQTMSVLTGLSPVHRAAIFEISISTLQRNEITDNHEFVEKCLHLIDLDGGRNFFESAMIYMLMKSLVYTKRRHRGKLLGHNKHAAMQILATCSWVGSPTIESATRSLQSGLGYLINKGIKIDLLQKPSKDSSAKDLFNALKTADELSPQSKETLMLACATVFGEDGMVSADERAYLRLLSSSLGAPIPLT